MKKAIIGVLGNTLYYTNQSFANVEKYYANSSYVQAVEKNGGIPLIIPYMTDEESLYRIIDFCDGLLFPGGEDVDPKVYNENPHALLGEIKPEVDVFLTLAMNYAIEKHLPILGICKGMQILNVCHGGSLYQDISQRNEVNFLHCQYARRDYAIHEVSINSKSNLYNILKTEKISTNSMHHQSVKCVGNNLTAVAQTDDGIIEGIESKDGQFIGVQWHPEEMIYTDEKMNLLFKNLIKNSEKKN